MLELVLCAALGTIERELARLDQKISQRASLLSTKADSGRINNSSSEKASRSHPRKQVRRGKSMDQQAQMSQVTTTSQSSSFAYNLNTSAM